jgi:antitoxin PrlF
MTVAVTSKGQVTIPKRVRELMGIKPGSRVDFKRCEDGRLLIVTIERTIDAGRFGRLRGHAGKGSSTDEVMALTRNR